jgi:hypothetical protein
MKKIVTLLSIVMVLLMASASFAAGGSAVLTWVQPTTCSNGGPMTECPLTSNNVYVGTSPAQFSAPINITPLATTYTVTGLATTLVNGVCGSANGVAVGSAPATNLCATGTASAVSGSGPWSWSCNGNGSLTYYFEVTAVSGLLESTGSNQVNKTFTATNAIYSASLIQVAPGVPTLAVQ